MKSSLEKSVSTTRERGATLFTDGYRAEPTTTAGVYQVFQPEGKRIRSGQRESYFVNVVAQTCNCEGFARLGECKHLIGLTSKVAEAVAFLGPLLPVTTAPSLPPVRSNPPAALPLSELPAPPAPTGYGTDDWKRRISADFD